LKELKAQALEAQAGKPADPETGHPAIPPRPVGLVVDGNALHHCLEEEAQAGFLDMCKLCMAVVCCRVTPMQKALVGAAATPAAVYALIEGDV
jgi:magnesium-transporting ATPase (P-type)